MLVHSTKFQFLLPLLLWFPNAFAQQVVELNLSGSQGGFIIRTLASNGTSVRQHRGPMLFCDRAAQHSSGNKLSAFGHILLVQGDSITIKSDSLLYDTNNQQATLYGHVMFQDRRTILTTERLVYSLSLGVAQFINRARVVDNRTVVTSQQGTYNIQLKQFTFRNNVRVMNGPKSMTADSLRYTTTSQLAVRLTPSLPISKPSVLVAQQNTRSNADKQVTTSAQRTPELADPVTSRDTLIARNRITSTTTRPVAVAQETKVIPFNQPITDLSAPKPKSVVTTAVLASTDKMPPLDSVKTQPSLYRARVLPAVTASLQVKHPSDQPVTSKPVARASIMRTAVTVSAHPATDISQESDLERELNKKKRFN